MYTYIYIYIHTLLRQAIWPRAFYGVSSCLLGWAHLRQLRTEAIKALGVKLAAVAPGLRLALLLCHEQCDPGFYQVWNVCQTFRRLARKRPMFLQLWQNYMDQYNGDLGKSTSCPLCEEPNSPEHRCTSCPARITIYEEHRGIILSRWREMTPAKRLHLLPSVNPYWFSFRKKAGEARDVTHRLHRGPQLRPLFLDI